MKLILPILAVLALCGCSSDSGTTEPPAEGPSGEVIDYSAIEGDWAGWDDRGTYAFDVSIAAEAPEGEKVGDFEVLRLNDGRLTRYCVIQARAEYADPPTYVFDGTVGTCTPTTLTFQHDPTEDRIVLFNTHGESGYLLRGEDRGPPPQ